MRLRNIPGADDAILNSEYCIKNPEEQKGHWQDCFETAQPLHIEIGMGKGRFIMELAKQNPDINYIGIERYSSVLLRGLQKRAQLELNNIYFMCIDAKNMADYFAPGEVDKIYLNFSDPWPKVRHAKRRLTSRQFLERYDKILAPEGTEEFKTDNRPLVEFSLEEVKEAGWVLDASTFDLHHDAKLMEGNVMTEYEEKFSRAGNPIHKMIIHR